MRMHFDLRFATRAARASRELWAREAENLFACFERLRFRERRDPDFDIRGVPEGRAVSMIGSLVPRMK